MYEYRPGKLDRWIEARLSFTHIIFWNFSLNIIATMWLNLDHIVGKHALRVYHQSQSVPSLIN